MAPLPATDRDTGVPRPTALPATPPAGEAAAAVQAVPAAADATGHGDRGCAGHEAAQREEDAAQLLSRPPLSPATDDGSLAAGEAAEPGVPNAPGGVTVHEEKQYEDLFDMMMRHWPSEQEPVDSSGGVSAQPSALTGADGGPPEGLHPQSEQRCDTSGGGQGPFRFLNPKRPRLAAAAPAPASPPLGAAGPDALARRGCQGLGPEGEEAEAERPPDRIVAAYARLDLPLTATARDVERKSRRLARHAHPDKVPAWMRPQAAQDFRELQEAKAVVLAWLRDRVAPEDSDSPVGDATSDEEGGLLDPNTECVFGEEDIHDANLTSSESDERFVELEACGIPRLEPFAEPPAQRGEDSDDKNEHSGGDDAADARVALAGSAAIRAEDSVLDQATALSRYNASGSQRRRACSECLERAAPRGADVCRQCHIEMRRLWRKLSREPGS